MPYLYSHAILAQRVYQQLEQPIRGLLDGHLRAFYLGAQGPDPFLYDNLPVTPFHRNLRCVGNWLHGKQIEQSMLALWEYARDNPTCEAYMLGYLCHYALDCSAHPYIRYWAPGRAHTVFEAKLDSMLLQHEQIPLIDHPPKTLFCVDEETLAMINAMYETVLDRVFEIREPGLFRRSYRKMLRLQNLAYDPKARKLHILSRMEVMLKKPRAVSGFLMETVPNDGIDYLNLSRREWMVPWMRGCVRDATYFELLQSAQDDAVRLCRDVYAAWRDQDAERALTAIGHRSFDLGLDWRTPVTIVNQANIYEDQ